MVPIQKDQTGERMKLEKWALIAEIVGAVAIVVSLIFVGLQVRDAGNATYADTYDRLIGDLINWRVQVATSPIALRGWEGVLNPDSEENHDPLIARAGTEITTAVVQIWERAYFAHFYGRLNDAEWNRFKKAICNPGYHEIWERAGVTISLVADEFWQYASECSAD